MEDRYMRYFKIHWIHSFTDEPEYIFSEIDEEGYEVRKVEIFKNGNHILYSNNINSDRLVEGKYPSLEELNYEEETEVMQTIEIPKSEFCNVWLRYHSD